MKETCRCGRLFVLRRLQFSSTSLAVALSLGLLGCGDGSNVASDPTTVDSPSVETSTTEFASPDSSDRASTLPATPSVADVTQTAEEVVVAAAEPLSELPKKPIVELPPIAEEKAEPDRQSVVVAAETASGDSEVGLDPRSRLEDELAAFRVPPAWLEGITPKWDIAKPWKDGRVEIRRLLGKGDDVSRREGIKLTWEYLQKNDIGNGHEYGMYMFLGNEPLWAIHVYREWVAKTDHAYPPYFGLKALASLYADYGLFEEAEGLLERGLKMSPPDPKWNEMRQAEMHDAFGDLYARWEKTDKAKASYQEAARLYPLGKPPYGRHLLPRRAKKVQGKLDLLSKTSLDGTSLRDGRFRETALGYSGDIKLTIDVKDGRIADIDVQHQEKIDQNACVMIPRRIISKQSLQVDGISGATVTKDAIVAGTLRALKKAGLK